MCYRSTVRPILDIRSAKVAVELTSRCNLRCGMCPMGNRGRAEPGKAAARVRGLAPGFRNPDRAAGAHRAAARVLIDYGKLEAAAREVDQAAALSPGHPDLAELRAILAERD